MSTDPNKKEKIINRELNLLKYASYLLKNYEAACFKTSTSK